MNWYSIPIPDLSSNNFRSAPDRKKLAWLLLCTYCAHQENGGTITEADEWEDGMWLQTCGLSKAEVHEKSLLWSWSKGTLTVWNYNRNQEEKARNTQEQNRLKGKKSSEKRANKPPQPHTETPENQTQNPTAVQPQFNHGSTTVEPRFNEEKRREARSREENGSEAPLSLERSDTIKAVVSDKPEVIDRPEDRGVGGRSEEELEARDKSVKTIGEMCEERLRKRADERKAGDGGMNRISDVMSPSGKRESVFDDDSSSTGKPEPEELVRQMLGIEPPRSK